ncbi:hypothetical protein ONE63_008443 [Megalurothrips usitatus]|uniref:Uncharacterized protein n=1 Tax=Megalurothrips usitatus TaxID=439358 RepID=A0AAV7XQE1_9NEOP|nr:hypothetical protein ONE63_008443 [Megalurothrips usitatus]
MSVIGEGDDGEESAESTHVADVEDDLEYDVDDLAGSALPACRGASPDPLSVGSLGDAGDSARMGPAGAAADRVDPEPVVVVAEDAEAVVEAVSSRRRLASGPSLSVLALSIHHSIPSTSGSRWLMACPFTRLKKSGKSTQSGVCQSRGCGSSGDGAQSLASAMPRSRAARTTQARRASGAMRVSYEAQLAQPCQDWPANHRILFLSAALAGWRIFSCSASMSSRLRSRRRSSLVIPPVDGGGAGLLVATGGGLLVAGGGGLLAAGGGGLLVAGGGGPLDAGGGGLLGFTGPGALRAGGGGGARRAGGGSPLSPGGDGPLSCLEGGRLGGGGAPPCLEGGRLGGDGRLDPEADGPPQRLESGCLGGDGLLDPDGGGPTCLGACGRVAPLSLHGRDISATTRTRAGPGQTEHSADEPRQKNDSRTRAAPLRVCSARTLACSRLCCRSPCPRCAPPAWLALRLAASRAAASSARSLLTPVARLPGRLAALPRCTARGAVRGAGG